MKKLDFFKIEPKARKAMLDTLQQMYRVSGSVNQSKTKKVDPKTRAIDLERLSIELIGLEIAVDELKAFLEQEDF